MDYKSIDESSDVIPLSHGTERLRFLAGIDKGIEDIDSGRIISHEDVKKRIHQWLSMKL